MSWTPELVDLLKKLWGSGLSAAKISEEISNKFSTRISRNAVIGKAHRLNLSAKIKQRITSSNNKKNIINPEKITRRERRNKFRSLLLDKDFEPAKNLTLEELTEKTCKYMVHEDQSREGHPDVAGSFFCGRDAVDKHSYCLYHMGLVWQLKNKKEDVSLKDDEVPAFLEKKVKSA